MRNRKNTMTSSMLDNLTLVYDILSSRCRIMIAKTYRDVSVMWLQHKDKPRSYLIRKEQ